MFYLTYTMTHGNTKVKQIPEIWAAALLKHSGSLRTHSYSIRKPCIFSLIFLVFCLTTKSDYFLNGNDQLAFLLGTDCTFCDVWSGFIYIYIYIYIYVCVFCVCVVCVCVCVGGCGVLCVCCVCMCVCVVCVCVLCVCVCVREREREIERFILPQFSEG